MTGKSMFEALRGLQLPGLLSRAFTGVNDMTATQKVDPSVRPEQMEQKGEPRGSVPMKTTMAKPAAYSPPKSGPK